MAKRNTPLVPGEFYHIYNRGNSKQVVFLDDHDRERFVHLLYICNSDKNFKYRDDIVRAGINPWEYVQGEQLVSIGAWVLMPNHFHLYLTEPCTDLVGAESEEDVHRGGISLFMAKLSKAYAQYFNTKYSRTGSLFEGKFKSVHVNTDEQAKYLFSYIHLNPVKLIQKDWKTEGIKNKQEALRFLEGYKWSSFVDYNKANRPENKIINQENFPDYFSEIGDFENEIFDWLNDSAPTWSGQGFNTSVALQSKQPYT